MPTERLRKRFDWFGATVSVASLGLRAALAGAGDGQVAQRVLRAVWLRAGVNWRTMSWMRKRVCAVCGRPVEGLDGAREEHGRWFCSPSHFLEWEARPRRRPVPSGRVLGFLLFAVAIGSVVWISVSGQTRHPHPSQRPPVSDKFVQSELRAALKGLSAALSGNDPTDRHSRVLHVRLTPQADRVADAFVYAEYVMHDCTTMTRYTRALSLLGAVYAPMTPALCPSTLQDDRGNDSHLVRGSRLLVHNCDGGGAQIGIPLKATECLQYATEGHYVTQDNGSRLYECNGSYFDVFLQQFKGRWYVVGETDTDDWGGGCEARDVAYWKRRYPWL